MANEPRVTRIEPWQTGVFAGYLVDVANVPRLGMRLSLRDCMVADDAPLPGEGNVQFFVVCFIPPPLSMAADAVCAEIVSAIVKATEQRHG